MPSSKLIEWIKLPMYSIKDVSGERIDIQATFQPNFVHKGSILITKVAFLIISISSCVYEFTDTSTPAFDLALITMWGLLISIAYFIFSLAGQFYDGGSCPTILHLEIEKDIEENRNTSSIESESDDDSDTNSTTKPKELTRLQCITWVLFITAINTELVVSVLFWILVYKADPAEGFLPDFSGIYNHGVLLIALIIDGFGMHRYPIRCRQIIWVLTVYVMYVTWTVIHRFTSIGDPTRQDSNNETDDDAIYEIVNWKKRPAATGILMLLMAFVIPLFHGLIWCLSMAFPRRYTKLAHDTHIEK